MPTSIDFWSRGKNRKSLVVPTERPVLRSWHPIGVTARLFGSWFLAILAAFAQTPAFEVASIKPSAPDATRMNIQRDPGGGIILSSVKTDASIANFSYQGMNLFEGGHGGGMFYWTWNAPAFGGPRGRATLTVDPASNHGDYAEVQIHSPWSGKSANAAMRVSAKGPWLPRRIGAWSACGALKLPIRVPLTVTSTVN